jgi:hypothetical protein
MHITTATDVAAKIPRNWGIPVLSPRIGERSYTGAELPSSGAAKAALS